MGRIGAPAEQQRRLFSTWLLRVFDGVPRGPLRTAPVDSSGLAPRGPAIRFPPQSAPRATNGTGEDPYLLGPAPPTRPPLPSYRAMKDPSIARRPFPAYTPP
ncbi:unnamed protein product [Arctogadus glacialis]